MKTKRFVLITLLLTGIFSKNCFAQQIQVTVTNIDNFPVLPNDTAHEGQSDTLTVHVYNLAGIDSFFNDSLRVFLQNADTVFDPFPEILASIHIDTLHANDSLDLEVIYQYTQSTFKTGNNIVVVWPRIGGNFGTTYDSLQIGIVYFEPLLSVNMLNEQKQLFFLFPNPVTDEIRLNADPQKSIEYVRILNDIGQEILFRRTFEDHLNIRFLTEGFYFIEIKEHNGTVSRKKFLKL